MERGKNGHSGLPYAAERSHAEEKREAVRKCMQNVKVLEKLKENKLKEWHKEFQKQEENVMDDVVTAQSYRE